MNPSRRRFLFSSSAFLVALAQGEASLPAPSRVLRLRLDQVQTALEKLEQSADGPLHFEGNKIRYTEHGKKRVRELEIQVA